MKKRTDEDSTFVRARGVVESVADEIRKMTELSKKEAPKRKKKKDDRNPFIERDINEEKPH